MLAKLTKFVHDVRMAVQSQGGTLENLSKELGIAFSRILEQLKEAFPPPHKASNHTARLLMVSNLLERAEKQVVAILGKSGVPEASVKLFFKDIKPVVKALVVTIGMSSIQVLRFGVI